MGLRPGEKVESLGPILKVVAVRREPLGAITQSMEYGLRECELEGFGGHLTLSDPSAFVDFFCESHRGCTPDAVVTRIEFCYEEQ